MTRSDTSSPILVLAGGEMDRAGFQGTSSMAHRKKYYGEHATVYYAASTQHRLWHSDSLCSAAYCANFIFLYPWFSFENRSGFRSPFRMLPPLRNFRLVWTSLS